MFLLSQPALAATIPLSITTQGNSETLKLNLPPDAKAKVFTLGNPPRLVVDIPNRGAKPHIALPKDYAGKGIVKIRSGQFNTDTARVVFELSGETGMEASQIGRALTVVLNLGEAAAEKPKPKPKPVIIIDPGHGGEDPGATGPRGTREKKVVMDLAKVLKHELEASGTYTVVLTRSGDYFIRLRERVEYARKHKGNIFISLHADSASPKARGLSVYTISETASDKEAEALAAKENRSDIIAGMDLGTHDNDVANILISLAQRETNNQSALLADFLVGAMNDHAINLLENTHRMAGFAVLKAPDIPSVLVEAGFLSHPEEEKKLVDKNYHKKLARGIAAGIDRYFKKAAAE